MDCFLKPWSNYIQIVKRLEFWTCLCILVIFNDITLMFDLIQFPQVFPSCAQSFPNIGIPSDMSMSNNPSYLQFNSAQQLVSCCGGLINNMGISPPNMGLRRNISTSPVPLPETFLDSSCFTVGFFTLSCVCNVLLMISLVQILIWIFLHCSKFYPPQIGKVVISKAFTTLLLIKGEQHLFLLSHLQVATNLWLVKITFFLSLIS